MPNQLKKLWEDMKTNIKIRKEISEGKITKYDATLLNKIKPYDYYNVPMLVYLLNPSLGNYSHEMSLELASILVKENPVFLLKVPYLDYYLIEVTINDNKYIYDISKGLVYNKEYYFYLNPNSLSKFASFLPVIISPKALETCFNKDTFDFGEASI